MKSYSKTENEFIEYIISKYSNDPAVVKFSKVYNKHLNVKKKKSMSNTLKEKMVYDTLSRNKVYIIDNEKFNEIYKNINDLIDKKRR